MIGLFGTVVGMVETFAVIGQTGRPDAATLAVISIATHYFVGSRDRSSCHCGIFPLQVPLQRSRGLL